MPQAYAFLYSNFSIALLKNRITGTIMNKNGIIKKRPFFSFEEPARPLWYWPDPEKKILSVRSEIGVREILENFFFSRGPWTWPPWVICAPAFNHKIENAAHSGVSEVLFFTKSYTCKKRRWEKWTAGGLLLEIMYFWRPPTVRQFQDGWPRMRAQQKWKLLDVAWQCPDYSLLFPCSISFAEIFVTCLRTKAHVYLLTYK